MGSNYNPLRLGHGLAFLPLSPAASTPYTPAATSSQPARRPTPDRRASTPLAAGSPPQSYLSLAPDVSSSYPISPRPQGRPAAARHYSMSHLTKPLMLTPGPELPSDTTTTAAAPVAGSYFPDVPVTVAVPVMTTEKTRRSSSMSSEGSSTSGGARRVRFLKLGPVHWGEHIGEEKGDWHDVVPEEAVSP